MILSQKVGAVLLGAGVLLVILKYSVFLDRGELNVSRPHPLCKEANDSRINSSVNNIACCEHKYNSWEIGLVTELQPAISRDCKKLFGGLNSDINSVELKKNLWKNNLTDTDVLHKTSNCSWVKDNFYNNLYTTQLELSFPIAFVFVIYNSPQQVMRLLKLLYRPHNQYCISPDKKSGPVFIGIFRNLAKCLDNVHIASTLREVEWGHPSIMESQMCCYKDLMKIREAQAKKDKWKYVINLCGKELPLTTNYEIVSHLVQLNGTSMIDGELVKRNDQEALRRTWGKKPVPFSIPYAKGSAYMSLSQEFIHFLLINQTAIEVYKFFQKSWIPEEHYFATMYMLPGIPGGVDHSIPKDKLFTTDRYCWVYNKREKKLQNCHGKVVHNICIVEVGDLSWILKGSSNSRYAFFQNKYFMENDHVVMDCMEEKIVARNKLEYMHDCRCSHDQ